MASEVVNIRERIEKVRAEMAGDEILSDDHNILEHSYVPQHIILNKEEENKFREKYNIRSNADIPEISRFDPVAQVICMKPGQICKIIRPSKNAIISNYYRICLNK